jgi:replicative DNA helicase
MAATRPRPRTSKPDAAPALLLPMPEPGVLSSYPAERALVGACLVYPDRLPDVRELVPDPAMFYFEPPRQVYAAMLSLLTQGVAIDHITLPEELFTLYNLEPGEVRASLLDYTEDAVSPDSAAVYGQMVRDLADRREAYGLLRKTIEGVAHRGTEFRSLVGSTMAKLGARIAAAPGRPGLAGSVRGALDEIDREVSTGQQITGLPSGIPALDALTYGLQPGTLVVIGGRPSMGKTQKLVNFVRQAGAYEHDDGGAAPEWRPWPALIFTLEMSERGFCKRILKAEAGVDWRTDLTGRTAGAYLDAAARVRQWPLEVESRCNTVAAMQVRADVFRRDHPDGRMLLGIDYLSHLRLDYSQGGDRRDVLIGEQVTRPLVRMARDLEAVVILLAQIGRGGVRVAHGRKDGPLPPLARPMLSDLKDSGDLEQDADLVLFVHPLGPNGEHREDGRMELGLAKHRDGPTGWVDAEFHRALGRFRPWSH